MKIVIENICCKESLIHRYTAMTGEKDLFKYNVRIIPELDHFEIKFYDPRTNETIEFCSNCGKKLMDLIKKD